MAHDFFSHNYTDLSDQTWKISLIALIN